VAFGALLAGVALAMMRERSLSIWPAVGSLAVGCGVRILIDVVRGVG
jgi:hypothetical protein